MFRRLLTALPTWLLLAAPLMAMQAPSGQEGFVPASSLPQGEQLPASRFLIGSYVFFLVLMVFYLWTIWRRIGKVERDMQELERRHGAARR